MKGAAIDLGSNSFICYIFEYKNGSLKTLEDKIILTRLSEGVEKTKKISEVTLERVELAFKEFSQLCLKHNVDNIQAVATSAARDAENKTEFLKIAEKYKIAVQIISGDEEASLTFDGVKSYFAKTKGLIIDIGGGSTEFIYADHGKIINRVSLNVGVVRFTERYLKDTNFMAQEKNIRSEIQEEMKLNAKLLDIKNHKSEIFLAVSGTPTNASAIKNRSFETDKIEDSDLSSQDLKHIIKTYCSLTLDQRLEKFPYIESKRADVLPTGVIILDEALKFFNMDSYRVSTRGIRHGLAYHMFNSTFVH